MITTDVLNKWTLDATEALLKAINNPKPKIDTL